MSISCSATAISCRISTALCLPPLFIAWQSAFGVSFAELGLAVALMSGASAVFQTPVGFLVDRYGARRFLIGGALLMSLCITAMGFATSFWQILLLAPLSGMGNSVFHPADYAILSGSVDKDRMGRAFALHTFSGNLGFAAAPPLMALLAVTLGWRASLILVGLLGVPVAISILLQSGILKDQVRHEPTHAGPVLSGRELLTSRTMLLFFAFFLLGSMARRRRAVLADHRAAHGEGHGAGDRVLGAHRLHGRLDGRRAGRRLVRRHLQAPRAGLRGDPDDRLGGADRSVNWVPMSSVAVIAVMFASGLALGASRTPRDVMLKDAAPPGQIGKVFGFVSAGLPLGGALTPVPFGWLIDRGHPELILVLVAVLLLASLLCVGTARSVARREPVTVAAE